MDLEGLCTPKRAVDLGKQDGTHGLKKGQDLQSRANDL